MSELINHARWNRIEASVHGSRWSQHSDVVKVRHMLDRWCRLNGD